MNREDYIQAIIESSHRLKHFAMADRFRLDQFQLSKAQLELIHLLHSHERVSVKQAATTLGVSLSAVSQLADYLQGAGYIARINDEKDRRIIYLTITSEGQAIIKTLRKTLTSGMRAVMETLADGELATLDQLYKKMVTNAGTIQSQKKKGK